MLNSIIQALLRVDLVDELRLNVLPSVVGGGLRLFDEGCRGGLGGSSGRSLWSPAGSACITAGRGERE